MKGSILTFTADQQTRAVNHTHPHTHKGALSFKPQGFSPVWPSRCYYLQVALSSAEIGSHRRETPAATVRGATGTLVRGALYLSTNATTEKTLAKSFMVQGWPWSELLHVCRHFSFSSFFGFYNFSDCQSRQRNSPCLFLEIFGIVQQRPAKYNLHVLTIVAINYRKAMNGVNPE